DSHFDLPHVAEGLDRLVECDFAPFKALNDLPMGMTAHLVYEALDDRPATLSHTVMTTIRDKIGFDGLIMTDDISMKALSGTLGDLCRDALAAGCDVILACNGTLADRAQVAEASGVMTPAAMTRAARALAARTPPDDIDIVDLNAQLETLLSGQGHD
ncbi:MAG: glycoside hydrolase family 3 N-terminal domain-containing protein, partial [Sulfitobacter sp.]